MVTEISLLIKKNTLFKFKVSHSDERIVSKDSVSQVFELLSLTLFPKEQTMSAEWTRLSQQKRNIIAVEKQLQQSSETKIGIICKVHRS
ncbi:hypothetical protein NPIL_589901 [Nephila pilipes]|uniref:Uncharacterized protein n=1 Tax=Nephila pilipes TaxID=299642 RepID=A0A8X6MAV6_NEPPI|nr:hypothetical protein NPIL_589901 [Nephila pilipes]